MNRWFRFAAMLTLIGFLGATLGSLLPAASAATPCAMTMSGGASVDEPSDMSKSMPVCDGNLSCIIMVAMPLTADLAGTPVVFQQVRYWSTATTLAGLTIPPDPSPPKRLS